jgi:CDP-diacylglycerol---glycerol-3-phosphate 3-phosphatidyltransferase
MGSLVSPTLRSRVRASVEPAARLFGRVGLTPNALTLIGFGIAIVAAYFAATQAWLLAGLLVAFGAIFDLFDGALARATGTTSRFGAFMDSVFDRAGEAVVYLGILVGLAATGYETGVILAASAMASAFLVSYVRAKSESLGFTPGSGMANVGLAPREVRIVILVIGLIAAGLLAVSQYGLCPAGVFCTQTWQMALALALGLIAILAAFTTIQRIVHVYRQSKQES